MRAARCAPLRPPHMPPPPFARHARPHCNFLTAWALCTPPALAAAAAARRSARCLRYTGTSAMQPTVRPRASMRGSYRSDSDSISLKWEPARVTIRLLGRQPSKVPAGSSAASAGDSLFEIGSAMCD